MKIHQLSMFLENKPGRLSEPCRLLADAGINILTLSLADTQQFGILRIIVRDWEKVRKVLESAGCVVNVTEVVATEVGASGPRNQRGWECGALLTADLCGKVSHVERYGVWRRCRRTPKWRFPR